MIAFHLVPPALRRIVRRIARDMRVLCTVCGLNLSEFESGGPCADCEREMGVAG